MTAIHQALRNYVIGLLTGNTTAGTSLFDSKIDPYQELDLPAISVYTMKEDAGEIIRATAPREREMVLQLEVHIAVKARDGYSSQLDVISEQVRSLIDYDLGHQVDTCDYSGLQTTFDDSGKTALAIGVMTYDVSYAVICGNVVNPANLSPLNLIDLKYDMGLPTITGQLGPDGQIDAEDLVNMVFSLDFSHRRNSGYWILI